ncbi:MAG: CGNR zinc finger domain-containing protein [Gemmatimonadales bacterium]
MSDPEFLLLGDALWLEFVNTQAGPGRADAIPDPPAWLRWTTALRLEAPRHAADLEAAHRFREKLARLAESLAGRRGPSPSGVEAVNAELAAHPAHEQLVRVGGAWQLRAVSSRPPTALEAIARSAAETLATPSALVRACANPDCGLYLLDASTGQGRHWCSPARCGTTQRPERRRRSRLTPLVSDA